MRLSILRVTRRALLIWSGIIFLPAWLVTVRGLCDGEEYSWGVTESIRGRGTGGYFFLAPLTALFGLTMLALGWRGAMRPFHVILAAWHVPMGIAAFFAALRNREALRFQGDTLGIDISLAYVALAVLGSAAAGSLALACLEQPATPEAPPTAPNTTLIGIALVALPVQFLLLRNGRQHGLTDKLGVILTVVQWTLINVGLATRKR